MTEYSSVGVILQPDSSWYKQVHQKIKDTLKVNGRALNDKRVDTLTEAVWRLNQFLFKNKSDEALITKQELLTEFAGLGPPTEYQFFVDKGIFQYHQEKLTNVNNWLLLTEKGLTLILPYLMLKATDNPDEFKNDMSVQRLNSILS